MLRAFLAACAVLLLALPASSCRSRCQSDVDCVKACQCDSTGEWCPIGLICENTFCEMEESIPCGAPGDEFCAKYSNRCGSRRCDKPADCQRTCFCNLVASTEANALHCCFDKKLTFQCEPETDLCEPAYSEDCSAICGNIDAVFTPTCQGRDRRDNTAWDVAPCPVPIGPPAGPAQ